MRPQRGLQVRRHHEGAGGQARKGAGGRLRCRQGLQCEALASSRRPCTQGLDWVASHEACHVLVTSVSCAAHICCHCLPCPTQHTEQALTKAARVAAVTHTGHISMHFCRPTCNHDMTASRRQKLCHVGGRSHGTCLQQPCTARQYPAQHDLGHIHLSCELRGTPRTTGKHCAWYGIMLAWPGGAPHGCGAQHTPT